MHAEDRYLFDISEDPQNLIAAKAGVILDAVWRFDFSAPGFGLLDLGSTLDSHQLRALTPISAEGNRLTFLEPPGDTPGGHRKWNSTW